MLQQTQVGAVLPYYNKWLRRFPTFAALAKASENNVLLAWQGLGYYARARNLRATAKIVHRQYRGTFPREIDGIRKLPGIGSYTAHAVATFAFDQSVPVVEVNTSRVLARLFDLQTPIDRATAREKLWRSAAALVPKHNAGKFNSALMDLGATICLPKPRCPTCPVQKFCRATNPEQLPFRKSRPALKKLTEDHALIVRQNRILLQQSAARWRKMWIMPPLYLDGLKPSRSARPSYTLSFPFTHHRVTLRVFRKQLHRVANQRQRWFSIRRLRTIPIPSPHRRALAALLNSPLDVKR